MERVAKHHHAYPPGHGWGYTDADFNLLGAMIEVVSGETFPDYLASHVFAKAGLARTTALACRRRTTTSPGRTPASGA